jgi:putative inorganic carbon (hco3(-)) transporter
LRLAPPWQPSEPPGLRESGADLRSAARSSSAPILLGAAAVLVVLGTAIVRPADADYAFAALTALVVIPAAAYAAWRVHPAYLLCAGIALSPIAGNWPQLGVPGVLAPDRLLLVAGIGSVLGRAPAVRDRLPFRLAAVHYVMAVAVAYVLASAFAAGVLFDNTWFLKLFDTFGIAPFLIFLVAPIAFREERHRDALMTTFVVLGAYLGLTTLLETIHLDALVFPHYIVDPNYGIHFDRGRGPFVEAVTNGFGMYTCAVASAMAWRRWRGERRGDFAGAVALLCVAGIVMTLERSIWLGAAAGTVIAAMTLGDARRAALRGIAAIALAIGIALVAIPGAAQSVSNRFGDQETVHDRQNLATAAFNMVEARPLVGFGWGQFQPNSADYFQQAPDFSLGPNIAHTAIHSTVLTYAVELGLIGVALWAIALAMGVIGGLRHRGPPSLDDWRVGLIAIAVCYVTVVNFVPPSAFPNLMLWLWTGIAWVGFQPAPPKPVPERAAAVEGQARVPSSARQPINVARAAALAVAKAVAEAAIKSRRARRR